MKVFSSFGVILSLALLELFHCAPLITGLDSNLNVLRKFKNLATTKFIGDNLRGFRENFLKDLNNAIATAPLPNIFGSDFGSHGYFMPNYPANGSPYYIAIVPLPVQPFTQQPIQPQPPQQPQAGSQNTQQLPQQETQVASQVTQQPIQQYPLQQPQVNSQNTHQQPPEAALSLVQEVQPTRV